MNLTALIAVAIFLDWLLGDPPTWPHPVKLIGRLCRRLEEICRKLPLDPVITGGICVGLVLLVTGGVTVLLLRAAVLAGGFVHGLAAVVILFTCFALRDLLRHAFLVHEALTAQDLGLARQRVAMIVGRDTANLDREGVVRACIESVAENMVDGVTAPLFYAFVGGPVAAMLYKAVNTMDSMFGYRNERYERFGKVAARLDDAANFLPARLTGPVIVAAAFLLGKDWRAAWRIFGRDRLSHKSPNSAHSEAAVAGALGVRLGGPSVYFGVVVDKPYIGDGGKPAEPGDIVAVNRLAVVVMVLFFFFGMLVVVPGFGL
ncbi:MAG: adenosylcobinamide-phosphate synthase CbiB [Thermodesulfobacteriota bacterium]